MFTFSKISLLSFTVVNAVFLAVHSILLSNLIPFAVCFASKLMASSKQSVAFLYDLVMLPFNIFFYSVGSSPYMFVVLYAGKSKLVETFAFATSAFIKI